MGDSANQPPSDASRQRDALTESEKKAHEQQPENFKDEAIEDKIVEIAPDSNTKGSIQGLDPKK